MAQHPVLQPISTQQLDEIFLTSLSAKEYQYCLGNAQIINADLGKLWLIESIAAGVYIILAGKVRLLDQDDEPIESLSVGQYFGEYTFFPGEDLTTYTARAGVNVQIWFLPLTVLNTLAQKYPTIEQQLWATFQLRCGESATLGRNKSIEPLQAITTLAPVELPLDRFSVREATPTSRKISKAYFPNPVQTAGHLFQRVTRRYPYFAQQSASDCGAACLVMVSSYWGKKFSVNRLRDLAKVDRNRPPAKVRSRDIQ